MHIIVREYGCLGTADNDQNMDYRRVSTQTFELLRKLAYNPEREHAELIRPCRYEGHECLQVVNYVGLIQLQNGDQIEILPKTSLQEKSLENSRNILWRMLHIANNVPYVDSGAADLSTLEDSWLEALTSLVLQETGLLIKKGIRNLYVRRQEEFGFLKGQLRVAAQMRARPGTQHRFHVSYDQFLPDRAENRLIKRCLEVLNRWTTSLENKRLCREYLFTLDNIPALNNHKADLKAWRNNRNMAYYQPLLPWIRLILSNEAPVFSQGIQQGCSLLFPMEALYENYVTRILQDRLPRDCQLVAQASGESLVKHQEQNWFRLRPDLMITQDGQRVAILDTKWKLIQSNQGNARDKYGISQADMYQLFAYGQKYLGGKGELFLIYPSHEAFTAPLPPFHFDDKLALWALPFDLNRNELVYNEGTVLANLLSNPSKQMLSIG